MMGYQFSSHSNGHQGGLLQSPRQQVQLGILRFLSVGNQFVECCYLPVIDLQNFDYNDITFQITSNLTLCSTNGSS